MLFTVDARQHFNLLEWRSHKLEKRRASFLLHYPLINSCSVGTNLTPPSASINYAPVWIREDLLDRGRLKIAGILLINDDHDNPLFY